MNQLLLRLLASVSFWLRLIATAAALSGAQVKAQCPTTPLTSELQFPSGIIQSPLGNLLVAENGASLPNTGRISIVDLDGNRRTLLDGLPSGINEVVGPAGPSGLFMRGRSLYVAIGVGDATQAGPIVGTEMPNPNSSSPIFASVLAIKFSAGIDSRTQGFTLTLADHQALADGEKLRLGDRGDRITVEMIADFPDFTPDPLPSFPDNVRHSNPFHLIAIGGLLYVTDSGMNSVRQVDISSGAFSTLTTFEPIANPLPFGPRFLDAVTTGIAFADGQLLVTQLTGFPSPPGKSEVHAVNPRAGSQTQFFTGLTAAIDVLPLRSRSDTDYLVLEFSTDLLANQPGRLLRFERPGGIPAVIADCLISPSAMTYDREARTLYLTETFTGRIVALPIE